MTENLLDSTAANLAKLEIFGRGALPIEAVTQLHIKTYWHCCLKNGYPLGNERLRLSEEELEELFMSETLRDIPLPRYMALIEKALGDFYYENRWRLEPAARYPLHLYMAQQAIALAPYLAPGRRLPRPFLDWLAEPFTYRQEGFPDVDMPRAAYILSALSDAEYHKNLRRQPEAAWQIVAWFCSNCFSLLPGYSHTPWFQKWLAEPFTYRQEGFPDVDMPRAAYVLSILPDSEYHRKLMRQPEAAYLLIAWFCYNCFSLLPGYSHAPWFQKWLDSPAPIPEAATCGIANMHYAFCKFTEPHVHSLDTAEAREAWKRAFVDWWTPRLEQYRHPAWAEALLPPALPCQKELLPKPSQAAWAASDSPAAVVARHPAQGPAVPCIGGKKQGGVNIIGWPRTENGVGEDARLLAHAFADADIPFVLINAADRQHIYQAAGPLSADRYIVNGPVYDTDLVVFDAATVYRYYAVDILSGNPPARRIIAVSPWELPKWPEYFAYTLERISVMWAATQYIHDAFSRYFSPDAIRLAPPSVFVPEDEKDDFDVCAVDGPFTFLTTFDGESGTDRKNPFAVITAFKQAFFGNTDVRLLVKAMNLNPQLPATRAILERIGNDPRVTLLNQVVSRQEVYALVRSCHCFVSLHRSEGFGRNIAEAMALGRPVIVSDFSGNRDFCTDETAYLVSGSMIPIQPGQYFCARGQYWFDASIDAAAAQMRHVYEDRATAQAKAQRAAECMRTEFSIAAAGRRYKRLLREANIL